MTQEVKVRKGIRRVQTVRFFIMSLFWYSFSLYPLQFIKPGAEVIANIFSSGDIWKPQFSWVLWSSLSLGLSPPHSVKTLSLAACLSPGFSKTSPVCHYRSGLFPFHAARCALPNAETGGQWLLIPFNTQSIMFLLQEEHCPKCSHYTGWFYG